MSAAWVKAALPPMLGPLPGWVAVPLPYVLINFSVFSVSVFAVFLALAMYMTSKDRNLSWCVRRMKTIFRGGRIQSRPLAYRRRVTGLACVSYFNFVAWRNK